MSRPSRTPILRHGSARVRHHHRGRFVLLQSSDACGLTLLLGGATGCVVAGRLAAADPSLTILLIEAGPTTKDDTLHTQPARYLYHLRPETSTAKFHVGRESEALGGRAPVTPCGQCVGGGSSVNCEFMIFTCVAPRSTYRVYLSRHVYSRSCF